MRKLAIAAVLVITGLSACRRQAVVTSAPAAPVAGAPAQPSAANPGAATPRDAVTAFLASAKAQDLEAMSIIWGSSAGPARATMGKDELEKREIIMMRCLRHNSAAIVAETPVAGGERLFVVELNFGTLTARTNTTTTQGPRARWYVRMIEIPTLQSICTAK